MKQHACQLSLILLAAAAPGLALAGPDILKCVDNAGHVTLTDQPCPAGSKVSLVIPDAAPARPAAAGVAQVGGSGGAGATGSGGDEPQVTVPAATVPAPEVERMPAPPAPPRGKWRPPASKQRAPLSRDEATLKAARMRMMIKDDAARQAQ